MIWTLILTALLQPQAQEALSSHYPGAQIVSSSACRVGPGGTDAFGAVVVVPHPGERLGGKHLRAVIGVRTPAGWRLHELPRSVSADGVGSVSDFLDEFISGEKVDPAARVVCTVPSAKGDIDPSLGKYLLADRRVQQAPQLCFAASAVYNSWVCFALDHGSPRPSFLQLLAD